jgi:hypothetical protein
MLHLFLKSSFTHVNIQLEEFSMDTFRSPESIVCRHFFDQANRLGREPRLSRVGFRCALPEQTEELMVPAQKCLRLDKKEGLFPGPNHPGQQLQEKSVRLPIDGSFHLSPQDAQLVPQQRVFCNQFSFVSGHIGECAEYKGGRQWFDLPQNTFLEHMQDKTEALLDRGTYTQHGWNLFFVKMSAWSEPARRMVFFDCVRIPHVLARKFASCFIV